MATTYVTYVTQPTILNLINDNALKLILTFLPARNAFRFCTTCQQLRKIQLPLIALAVGGTTRETVRALSKYGLVHTCADETGAHRVVESLSARHRKEIRYLEMNLVQIYDRRSDGWLPCLAAPEFLSMHGRGLDNLRILVLSQPPAGYSGAGGDLQVCTSTFLLNVAPKLVALSVHAQIRFGSPTWIATQLLPICNPNLKLLKMHAVPWSAFRFARPQSERDASLTTDVVQLACLRFKCLLLPAQILCHAFPHAVPIGAMTEDDRAMVAKYKTKIPTLRLHEYISVLMKTDS